MFLIDTTEHSSAPSISSERSSRDAVDCFVELFEFEGFSLLPDIPIGKNKNYLTMM